MQLLLAIVVSGTVLGALELLWRRPEASPGAAGAEGDRQEPGATAEPERPRWDPFALPFVRWRLEVLSAELKQLDDDPVVFAKAFHTQVVTAAYEALREDAARLGAVATLELHPAGSGLECGPLEMEFSASATPLREVLEV